MLRVFSINSLPYGSTGSIMRSIAKTTKERGYEAITYCGNWKSTNDFLDDNCRSYGYQFENKVHAGLGYLTGFMGCFSIFGTLQLIKKIDIYSPDIIHLHNMHLWTINLPILFKYIRKKKLPIVWTLHDCWTFTGKCPHFTLIECNKWKTGCHHCPQLAVYPATIIDRTKYMWNMKKNLFSDVPNMTIVTPSDWLAKLVKQSYFDKCDVKVINNGIDLNVFKPVKSTLRQKYDIEKDKFVVLGVAFDWSNKKGLDVFVKLSEELDERYVVVLVGVSDQISKILPDNIVKIYKTNNAEEMVDIYSGSTVFVNPTREENFPTVNIESLACGTPVVTFNTGGSPEIVDDKCGIVVDCDDINQMIVGIKSVCERNTIVREKCLMRASQYDEKDKFDEYIDLYEQIILKEESKEC